MKKKTKIIIISAMVLLLGVTGYLNVVEATEQEKSVNNSFPKKMFVIEDLGVDAKLIVGDERGNMYLLQRDKKRLVCESFLEYVEKQDCVFEDIDFKIYF